MILSLVIGMAIAGTPALQEMCAALPKGATAAAAQAADKPWYISGDPIIVTKKSYSKYGLPRVLGKGDVAFFESYKGVAVYAEAGNPQREVVYVLTNLAHCEFQPYQIAP
ncbi:MAG: hypothetical protein V4808_04620 [Pseudomonadota bacterium]